MKMIILFTDAPNANPELRARHMSDHLAFLDANRRKILAAGPLVGADGVVTGGLWLIDVAGCGEAERLIKADPFYPTGLRQGWEIREWRQVFADGRRRI